MKGIILAGGTGTRLWPNTISVSKQLLPIYNKPIIYYSLSTLMLAGIREVLIITTSIDQPAFKKLLGAGENFGISLSYAVQNEPKGIAEAFIIGREFIGVDSVALILGDNFFYGLDCSFVTQHSIVENFAQVFVTEVSNPSDYGVIEFDSAGRPCEIIEKPISPNSRFAVTGLYYFDSRVVSYAESTTPSLRGELEITEILNAYLQESSLHVSFLSRGSVWLDTGTPDSLHDASAFVRTIEDRTGTKIGCLEEIAWRNSWISDDLILEISDRYKKTEYGRYLRKLLG
jgi:glucose-1-phosphate thymidylyltransferase